MQCFRTIIVDDFEEFRRFICSTLERMAECEVVGEASDGLQAVIQAEQLQPDLVLLDLGLPTINGVEVARRVRKLSPNSKILFVSENSCREIVQGALDTGANGYLLKSDAGNLVAALERVLKGEQYVSSSLKHSHLKQTYNNTPKMPTDPIGAAPSLSSSGGEADSAG
jgi:DNA-binding NarL/FixJ family response regulator